MQFELSKKEIKEIKKIEKEIPLKNLSKKQWTKFSEIFTYHTNAIEGSKLTQKQVKDILKNK